MDPLLQIEDLAVHFDAEDGPVRALDRLSLSLGRGECLALVGESGSGKSMTGLSVMRLLPPQARIAAGSVRLDGRDLLCADERAMRRIRGRRVAMVFQNAKAGLNPIRRVGDTLCDILIAHDGGRLTRRAARGRIAALLGQIGITDPERRLDAYPSQLSGGLCQRIMIAAAFACSPELIIADEPTSALDVTTQKLVMDLLMAACRDRGVAALFITHDLALASQYCDRVCVMRKGRVVEEGSAGRVFTTPAAAYTRMLIDALPTGKGTAQEWRAAIRSHAGLSS
ncbi:ABC transporter ATP-binding protein [Methylobacterium variabile]|jgi:peptide/nickel transport system ATP-binding protein|uniref:ABC transporter ATP-binding protein n=1 Tax=Methylobacterium variabile TaxID=298794 RepID=UPI00069DA962|nr:ABC transporter ATP-binding protein [Methylobacterium variabile]